MKKHWMGIGSAMILAASTLSACSDAPANIGDKSPALTKSDLAAYAASWNGYVEAYQFTDTTDRVQLVLDEHGNGTLRFGDRALVLPPTDPLALYPPDATLADYAMALPFGGPQYEDLTGFDYTVSTARVESERIQLGAARIELFSAYCALQTPYAILSQSTPEETKYACLPHSRGGRHAR